jgi:hypothetical protein
MPCEAFSTSAILAESYSFIWQPWVLMKSLGAGVPLMRSVTGSFDGVARAPNRAVYSCAPGVASAAASQIKDLRGAACRPRVRAVAHEPAQRCLSLAWIGLAWRRRGATLRPMFAAARQGGSGGSPVRALPHRASPVRSIHRWVVTLCALALGWLWLPAAAASSLYHCTGPGGETAFSSTTAGYTRCKLVSHYPDAPHRRAQAKIPDARPARAAWSPSGRAMPDAFGELQASVMTTARVAPERVRGASLAAIEGSVQTTAQPLDAGGSPAASDRRRGSWDYHEAPVAASLEVAADATNRVLRGAVYRVVRGDGSVEYTNVAPTGKPGHAVTMLFTYLATCVACNLHSPVDWNHVRLNVDAYAQAIRAASAESGVDEAFLRAIIHAESAFNPRALSIKGAQGLMQLMPGTAGDMGVRDAFDAEQNIRGGARYLAVLLRDFNGNERLAAAAYNAGAGAVQRYNGVPPYAETQVYVERVGVLRKRYSELTRAPLASLRATASGF